MKQKSTFSISQIIAGFIILTGIYTFWKNYSTDGTIEASNYVVVIGAAIFFLLRRKKSASN